MQPGKLRLLRKAEDTRPQEEQDASDDEADDEPSSPVDSDNGEEPPPPNEERAPDFREFRWDPVSADDWL